MCTGSMILLKKIRISVLSQSLNYKFATGTFFSEGNLRRKHSSKHNVPLVDDLLYCCKI